VALVAQKTDASAACEAGVQKVSGRQTRRQSAADQDGTARLALPELKEISRNGAERPASQVVAADSQPK
jgi:hypothetical protein